MSIDIKYFTRPVVAYFSMEIGLDERFSTYSGGLGILAGDTVRSSADLQLPFIAITLVSKQGYFKQQIDESGWQHELPDTWEPSKYMELLPSQVVVTIEKRPVIVKAWFYEEKSMTGGSVPVLLLDTDFDENSDQDRNITARLYGGDLTYRFKQEVILGIGGVRMLKELGFRVMKYHMNEGHASLLTLELLRQYRYGIEEVWDEQDIWNFKKVRSLCIFTTHTPVEAGHDRFPYNLVYSVLNDFFPIDVLKKLAGYDNLNMTLLGFNLSDYKNGVAKKHQEVSQQMFPGYVIHAITNGVHSYFWTCQAFRNLYDKFLPGWANEPEILVRAEQIPDEEIWKAHEIAKKELVSYINKHPGGEGFAADVFTISFARRATSYKRATLLFRNIDRLLSISKKYKIQIVFAGKAHPHDEQGKKLIQTIIGYSRKLRGQIPIIFLENYKIPIAKKMVSGSDIWLNTPLKPLEASGTSGMKAAHNGVINFSVIDGWWVEGLIEGINGWAIGINEINGRSYKQIETKEINDLYGKLENTILPLYYNDRAGWISVMKNSISKCAYFFNTHRMMRRYVTHGYMSSGFHQ